MLERNLVSTGLFEFLVYDRIPPQSLDPQSLDFVAIREERPVACSWINLQGFNGNIGVQKPFAGFYCEIHSLFPQVIVALILAFSLSNRSGASSHTMML